MTVSDKDLKRSSGICWYTSLSTFFHTGENNQLDFLLSLQVLSKLSKRLGRRFSKAPDLQEQRPEFKPHNTCFQKKKKKPGVLALRRQRQLANLADTASPRWETLPQKNRRERPEEQHWDDRLVHVTLEFMCVCIQTQILYSHKCRHTETEHKVLLQEWRWSIRDWT